MKAFTIIAFLVCIAISSAVFVPPRHRVHKTYVLGAKECTYGPTYWCQNITTAAGCNAVTHCIQTVWVHQKLPPDHSSICQTCLDMVKEARDNLESNGTQELIKQVFEGSCALIHLKPIVVECDKLVDEFIPELIETLASEMNPQVVCATAGLCNSERVNKLLEEAGEKQVEKKQVSKMDSCQGCHTVVGIIEDKFNKMSRDDFLYSLLNFCGNMGSFSDGCSNIMITYFDQIYSHLQDNLNANEVCLMSGECSAQFHKHANVEITAMSHIGYVPVPQEKDDLPCELCEQLVTHLRELLVANTTEDEFQKVLQGLCKQTGKFSQECLGLVNQYYPEVYQFLTKNLNSTYVCDMIGICNPTMKKTPIAPLLTPETSKLVLSIADKKPLVHVPLQKQPITVRISPPVEDMQLPIERIMPPGMTVLYNREICEFCEYFLHFVQQEITNPKVEYKIKDVLDKACNKLPSAVNETCIEFINSYEPAMVAILAQEIDPSQVCPLIRACPAANEGDVEVFMEASSDSKCPLCLFAVTKLESLVKDKKTKEEIQVALGKVCLHLPKSMADECTDLVKAYTNELIELLIADLQPEEICEYLKLCSDQKPASKLPPYVIKHIGGNIETNVIPDNTINGHVSTSDSQTQVEASPQCVICEFAMKEIEEILQNKKTQADIENAVHSVCNHLPSSVKKECNDFVDQYADLVIQLLIQALEPSDICTYIKVCQPQLEHMKAEIIDCPLCEMTAAAMEKILLNPNIPHDLEHVLEKTCRGLPDQYKQSCSEVLDKYGNNILMLLLNHIEPQEACFLLEICSKIESTHVGVHPCTYGPTYWCESEENADQCGARLHCESKVWPNSKPTNSRLIGGNKCVWGPAYWCKSEQNADECGARTHCETKVWSGPKPSTNLLGRNKCSWGPGYWCESEANAEECGSGARTHCETKVWLGSRPKRDLLGRKKCTWGPGYWCESEANADECGKGARTHCETKVWYGTSPKKSY